MFVNKCWICEKDLDRDNKIISFSWEFDCWYHEECLPEGCDNILEYENQKRGKHEIANVPTEREHIRQILSIYNRAIHNYKTENDEKKVYSMV